MTPKPAASQFIENLICYGIHPRFFFKVDRKKKRKKRKLLAAVKTDEPELKSEQCS